MIYLVTSSKGDIYRYATKEKDAKDLAKILQQNFDGAMKDFLQKDEKYEIGAIRDSTYKHKKYEAIERCILFDKKIQASYFYERQRIIFSVQEVYLV